MDFSKFKTNDWLVVGGGAGMLIFGFLNWTKVSVAGFGSSSGANAFDFFFTGTIPWLLLVASAVVTALLVMEKIPKDSLPWPLIILAATGLAAILLLIRFLFNPIDGKGFIEDAGGSVGRGVGLILSLLSGLVAAAGGVMSFTASGGNLKDLTDVNKIKDAFDKDDGDDQLTPATAPPADAHWNCTRPRRSAGPRRVRRPVLIRPV